MKWNMHFRSVKTRLAFWLLIVALVPMCTTVAILYLQRASVIREREFAKLQTVRDLKVRELNSWLEERLNDLAVASGDEEIRRLETLFSKAPDQRIREDHDTVAIARALLQRYTNNYPAYHEFFIVGVGSGAVEISSTETRERRDRSQSPYVTEALRTNDLTITPIYQSKIERKPAMSVSAPIRSLDQDGGHVFAVLVARIDLEHSLYPLLQENTGFGTTGETLVVNREGIALNQLRWHDNAPLNLKITAEPATRAAAGETGITETPDYRGEMVLAAYTHIPQTGWGFVAKRDLSEVYEPIYSMVWDMAILVAVSAAVAILLAVLLSKAISRPVLAISEMVRQVADGNLDARYGGNGQDEIAALGASINEMTRSLASQLAIQHGTAHLSKTMATGGELVSFASDLLVALIDATDSNIGAFYRRTEDDLEFTHIASVGLNSEAIPTFNAKIYEGEIGKATATRQITFIEGVSEDTEIAYKMTAGTAIPRELAIIPLEVNREVEAVISLATLGHFHQDHRTILEQVHVGLGTAFSNLIANERTARVAENLHRSNEELASLNEELQSQAEEMREQADELEAQRVSLEEANRLKSQFLSNMSHELRTPLNSVMALSQLILSRGAGKNPDQDTEYLEVIERNGRHLLNLINELLDLSKIESGRMEVMISDFDPHDVVARALDTTRLLAEDKGLSVRVDLDDVEQMQTDEEKVYQILLNLLSNAVKFTDEGEVAISLQATDGQLSFGVRDTGMGISDNDLEHIFDEFRQVDGSTTRKHGGTGLGLSIGRKLAELLGGDIGVVSTIGKGSEFTLTLPLQCPHREGERNAIPSMTKLPSAPIQTSGKFALPESRQPLILVVEDNEVAAVQIQSVLEDNDCDVSLARGGPEALENLKKRVPDAIVLDLMMPEVDGFQVLEQLRAFERTASIPVLILTAKELTAEDRARLTRNNIQELVQKGSVNREELAAHVAGLLSRLPEDQPRVVERAGGQRASNSNNGLILVVEDNQDNMLAITGILDELGWTYIKAEDGLQAVEKAKEFHPAMILMDMELPELSGIDAAKAIKSDPMLKSVPIVALTARAMEGDRELILAAGCDGYLSKPIAPAEVSNVIGEWLC